MRPPPGYRKGARPIYPGTLRTVVLGMVAWFLALLGFRLPFGVPLWLKLVLEVMVVWFIWRGIKAARRAPRNHLRLFNAQEAFASAFLVQAIVLLLRTG
ncbi:MAG TPA: hypothetical protein VFD04_13510 [Actinomycetes bacterium]|jgi:hypothetical protein|nr:hypothetical protein [Actinomycetes bacterium]